MTFPIASIWNPNDKCGCTQNILSKQQLDNLQTIRFGRNVAAQIRFIIRALRKGAIVILPLSQKVESMGNKFDIFLKDGFDNLAEYRVFF